MTEIVAIGIQDFEKIRTRNIFYVDKTDFIREWWESNDDVTLITRPRRFGKTLNMSMTEQFFSINYSGRSDLFEGLSVWKDEKYQKLQGTYPVISLSFAGIKENTYQKAYERMCQIIAKLYTKVDFIKDSTKLTDNERLYFEQIEACSTKETELVMALYNLSDFLERFYGKKVLILLDEYDTPMQEAYVYGYWEELVSFTRNLFNSTFKTNPHMERGLMTGITSVSHESMFSDLNNLKVVTTISDEYAEAFGFTEQEVFTAMENFGLAEQKKKVKFWYDGFSFGNKSGIYNPWSVINYLDTGKFAAYWANTSSNSLAGKLIREGSPSVKMTMEELLKGNPLSTEIDEQIVFNQLDTDETAIWSLLLASGYLKVKSYTAVDDEYGEWKEVYELAITNYETVRMFRKIIQGWFKPAGSVYNEFIRSLLAGDTDGMNEYMNRIALSTFSYFDTGSSPSKKAEPERFYHGFVLGLVVDLLPRYAVLSNRESGFGRYDVLLVPKEDNADGIILEFKVRNPKREQSLSDTVVSALKQIEEKQYEKELVDKGISPERIKKYGFAFEGKEVLIEPGSLLESKVL